MGLVQWFNQNQGFIMAILTLIYVIATILILISNRKGTRILQENLLLTDKIQKENVKLTLYTKRLDAFDSLNNLVIKINDDGPKSSYMEELSKTCQTVFYLFDDNIDTVVKKILLNTQRLRRIQAEHHSLAKTRKEKISLDEHEKHIHEDILEYLKQLTEKVNDYLDIGDIGIEITSNDTLSNQNTSGNQDIA